MTAEPLAEVFRAAMTKAGEAAQGPLLVACSGGADSMALLHVVHSAGYACAAAHFDHRLRGAESDADRDLAAAFAKERGIPVVLGTWERPGPANGESLEMAARRARYAFLCETARSMGCSALLTAHHGDDQAETVLMRLIRGTSPEGLGAISFSSFRDGVRILRPLLGATRSAIMAYINQHGVPYRDDASNDDTAILRNRIRRDLLPQLAAYNPNVAAALTRFAELQGDENEWMRGEAEARLLEASDSEGALLRRRFGRLHTALQRRVLALALARHGLFPPFERLEAARRHVLEGATGGRIDLGVGMALVNTRGRSLVRGAGDFERVRQAATALRTPGRTVAMGLTFTLRSLPVSDAAVERCSPNRQVFDADRLGPAAAVRSREDGDRFEPLGMDGTRKLQDCFVDWGVARSDRDRVPLLLAGDRIVWVVGYGVGRFAALSNATRRVVEVCVEPEEA